MTCSEVLRALQLYDVAIFQYFGYATPRTDVYLQSEKIVVLQLKNWGEGNCVQIYQLHVGRIIVCSYKCIV